MQSADTYNSILSPSEGLFRDNGSRFIALAYPVEDEARIKELVESARKEYHDARHHCFAYRLGLDGGVWRANDDGEPSGSAGRQILGQIDSAGLSDVLVIVVRYFGGIKLGIPGLIRAYRTATADALGKAERTEKVEGSWYRLNFRYELLPKAMKMLKDMDLPQRGQNFGADCSVEVRVRTKLLRDFLEKTENSGIFKEKIQ
ncbi:MAG: YigZ family protein [Bacteroidales bacterium]|nr:YigZ family protein [Bacteroidales bacterium]